MAGFRHPRPPVKIYFVSLALTPGLRRFEIANGIFSICTFALEWFDLKGFNTILTDWWGFHRIWRDSELQMEYLPFAELHLKNWIWHDLISFMMMWSALMWLTRISYDLMRFEIANGISEVKTENSLAWRRPYTHTESARNAYWTPYITHTESRT